MQDLLAVKRKQGWQAARVQEDQRLITP